MSEIVVCPHCHRLYPSARDHEQAEEYCERENLPYGRNANDPIMRGDYFDAFLAGHAAGRAEAEELVDAAERALKFGFVSVERKGELRNTHSDLTRALARFKAVKGE